MDFVEGIGHIVKRIRKAQSPKSPAEKIQSFQNFNESIGELERVYNQLLEAEEKLAKYDVEAENQEFDPQYSDLCDQLQREYVELTKAFHQNLYYAVSNLMNFLKTCISQEALRGVKTSSVSRFYAAVRVLSPQLVGDISTLEESLELRTLINHPEQFKNYDWMTIGGTSDRSLLFYFRNLRDGEPLKPRKNRRSDLPDFPSEDSLNPPSPRKTMDAFQRLTKNTLRRLTD